MSLSWHLLTVLYLSIYLYLSDSNSYAAIIIPYQVTELFDKLVKDEPDKIQCQEEKHALNAVLKINVSDPSSGPLRIPKQNNRPEDIILASGYKSKYNTVLASSTSGGLQGQLNLAF